MRHARAFPRPAVTLEVEGPDEQPGAGECLSGPVVTAGVLAQPVDDQHGAPRLFLGLPDSHQARRIGRRKHLDSPCGHAVSQMTSSVRAARPSSSRPTGVRTGDARTTSGSSPAISSRATASASTVSRDCRLGRLDHQRFLDDEREVHGRRVESPIEQSLGNIHRPDAVALLQAAGRGDELVHARAVVRDIELSTDQFGEIARH